LFGSIPAAGAGRVGAREVRVPAERGVEMEIREMPAMDLA